MEKIKIDKKVTLRLSEQERERYNKIVKHYNSNMQESLRAYVIHIIDTYWEEVNGN